MPEFRNLRLAIVQEQHQSSIRHPNTSAQRRRGDYRMKPQRDRDRGPHLQLDPREIACSTSVSVDSAFHVWFHFVPCIPWVWFLQWRLTWLETECWCMPFSDFVGQ